MPTKLPKTDVVVVGVGWAGGIIAAELTKQGVKVVGLERGKERKTEDYAMAHDELRYAFRFEMMQDLSRETVTFRNHDRMQALPMRQHGSFLLGDGLGGAGSHWNGMTYRFLPYDFQIYSETVKRYGKEKIPEGMTIQDWGVTYEEMEFYYNRFEQMAGIGGEENPLGPFRSHPYPTPPMKETPAIRLFKEAAKRLKLHPYAVPSANLSLAYTNPDGIKRLPCLYCGFCERFGCEYGAKADPVVTVIPIAKQTGNFDLRPYSQVRRVLYDGKKVSGVLYVNPLTGEEFEQPADAVVLTSYVMNNVRLLLLSKIGKPYDPQSGMGVIGKNYAYQTMGGRATGFFENREFNTFMGAGALGASLDDFNGDYFDHSSLSFIHGASISLTQTGARPIANNPVPSGTPSWGKAFKENSLKYANRTLSIGAQGASMPWKHHYLDLDPTYKDIYGDPLLRITFDFEEQDRKLVEFMGEKTGMIMKEMGASKVEANKKLGAYSIVPYQSTHNTGGVIMGAEPERSAVNSFLQMWDAENLFVVGASAFAHNSGYNPTGTVGALAYRAAEGILKYREKGGLLA